MTRALVVIVLLVGLAAPAGAAHGGGGHGGGMHGGGFHGGPHGGFHGGFHHGGHVFVGGSVFFDPFWYGYPYYYYPYPYYPYYPYDYPDYPPPPDEEASAQGEPPGMEQPGNEAEAAASPAQQIGTYGLVQLHGVPDGAAVDLDGRFWLTADRLDDRWLALPEGSHTITVRVGDRTPLQRTVDVKPGASIVVRFPSPRRG